MAMKTWEPGDIKKLRDKLELSQAAFGVHLGVSGNYVHLLEKGVRTPGKTLRLLLDCIEKEQSESKRKKRR
jgi:DNA-binding transcriptional regulator YiaG